MLRIASLFIIMAGFGFLAACGPEGKEAAEPEEAALEITIDKFVYTRRWGMPSDEAVDQGIGPTHGGVVVDGAGAIYTSADRGIYVFDADGRILRTMEAAPLQGLHAMTIVILGGEEIIYGAANNRAEVVKFKTDGEVLMRIPFPKESGVKGAFRPTGVAVTPAGHILITDGYGTNVIYEFDAEGKYLAHFGGSDADDPAKFRTPHGIAIDRRYDPARILVADREKRRLVHFAMDGSFISEVIGGLRRPCAVSILGDYVAIAELEGRVAILDGENKLMGVLGDNPNSKQWANYGVGAKDWQDALHTAPHGLSWDVNGNLYVQDWNATGRLTKWRLR
jgi:DNA-binding beta-propeller fold protein YncE